MNEISIGDNVLVEYNSGEYIGEFVEDRGNFSLVKVLAVKKHPTQGDLHNPGQVDGVAFFERKALAYTEKINARKRFVHPYDGQIPNYSDSLKQAVNQLREELLAKDTQFNHASLNKLQDLENHFYHKTDY